MYTRTCSDGVAAPEIFDYASNMLQNGGVTRIHAKRGAYPSHRIADLINFMTTCARVTGIGHGSVRINPCVDRYIVAFSFFDKRCEGIITWGSPLGSG